MLSPNPISKSSFILESFQIVFWKLSSFPLFYCIRLVNVHQCFCKLLELVHWCVSFVKWIIPGRLFYRIHGAEKWKSIFFSLVFRKMLRIITALLIFKPWFSFTLWIFFSTAWALFGFIFFFHFFLELIQSWVTYFKFKIFNFLLGHLHLLFEI